ncbi:hypothetical protein F5Y07DRAFT_156620 [Xylaria sp. FL0933]|nr:hypothetical protein F5Y07DRAFT_156620 [Xylaria sp. FL0933]
MPYDAYLLVSKLPGIPLLDSHDVLSDADLERIAARMTKNLVHIRSVPNRDASICNAVSEARRDSRIRDESPVGPSLTRHLSVKCCDFQISVVGILRSLMLKYEAGRWGMGYSVVLT